jgi:hypothetical protein
MLTYCMGVKKISMDVVINRLCTVLVYTATVPSAPWAICSDSAAAHWVACWETSILYNIYGLQVKSF